MNDATDENISPLDPRRFTPSLHASLVAEILSLRREAEGKTKDIERLETSLHTAQNENESLQETLASNSKETRSLKRQMQLLEGGTVSALSELSKERDEALSDSADLRKRLEQSQKKVRSHEESTERIQTQWDRDRGNWEKDKRALETKVHIVEGRLKVVLSEIANSQIMNGQAPSGDVTHYESPKKMHLRKGSAASLRSLGPPGRRRDSEVSTGTQEGEPHGYRLSTMSFVNGLSTSLADELAFDEEEEDQMGHNEAHDEQPLADELPEERPMSAHSRRLDLKARKILGLSLDEQLPTLPGNDQQKQSVESRVGNDVISKIQALYERQYVDAAVQYSPPASPTLLPTVFTPRAGEDDDKTIYFADALSHQEPDQTLRREHTNESIEAPSIKNVSMVSTSCQTLSELPTPPWTPLTSDKTITEERSTSSTPQPQMTCAATQTDVIEESGSKDEVETSHNRTESLTVPTITIHPPESRPTTPIGNVVLPPRTKNASCQVNIHSVIGYTSTSMQTEEIRVDSRTAQLPQKLLPLRRPSKPENGELFRRTSALQPANPLPNSSKRRLQQPGAVKPASSRRRAWDPTGEPACFSPLPENEEPTLPTRNDSLNHTSGSSPSFANEPQPVEEAEMVEVERKPFDEDDIFSRPTAKFTLRAGKLVSKEEAETNYQDIFDKIDAEELEDEMSPVEPPPREMPNIPLRRGTRARNPPSRTVDGKPRTLRSTSSKNFDIRKAALISSGTAAHQSSAQHSSQENASAQVKPPPFPVPTRHSSRKPPISISEGAQSPTPGVRSPRKRDGKGRKPLLRKVRSAQSITRPSAPARQQSPSPPLISAQYDATHDPGLPLPPMPFDDQAPPPGLDYVVSNKRRGPVRQYSHTKTDSASTVLQQTSVVDAIAQTMVGEWMYKYVRRRKSFGVPEPRNNEWDMMRNGEELSANITNTGVRHKRWVWLAPYERAVMWSSKQPTSGSALMGKSGRKRT
jgi:Meiotic cell cortex C-terminal pleckstrin homology